MIFARILLGLARDRGFKGIVSTTATQGLALARPFPSRRDHARHRTAGFRRLEPVGSTQSRSGDGRRAGARDLGCGRMAARTRLGSDRPPAGNPSRKARSPRRSTRCWASRTAARKNVLLVEDDVDPTQRDGQSDRQRRDRRDRRAHGRRSAGRVRSRALRLHHSGSRPAGYAGRRVDRSSAPEAVRRRRAGHRVHRARPEPPRGDAAQRAHRSRHRQRRDVAGAAARGDALLLTPGASEIAGQQTRPRSKSFAKTAPASRASAC